MSARPDDLGAGFDLALEEESASLGLSRGVLDHGIGLNHGIGKERPLRVSSTTGEIRWILPGHGAPREACGVIRTWGHREGPKWDGPGWDWWKHRQSCRRFDCPKCYEDWASREAGRITDRVMLGLGAHLQRVKIRKYVRPRKSARPRRFAPPPCGCVRQGTVDGDSFLSLGKECARGKDGTVAHWRWTRGRRLAVHVVIPPPPALWHLTATLEGYLTLRELAYAQMKAAGIDGACVVFHQYRLGDRWDNNRGGMCVAGPHFHALGDAWTIPTRKEDIANGKWAIWNIGLRGADRFVRGDTAKARGGTGDDSDKRAVGSIFATALYLLTHAPRAERAERSSGTSPKDNLPRPVQTVTWFGTWSYGRMKHPKPAKEGVPVVLCPVCKRMVPRDKCFELVNGGTGPPVGESGHAEESAFRAVSFDGWGANP